MILLLLALACTPTGPGSGGQTGADWVAPSNSWPQASTLPAGLAATGYEEGDVPPDVRLPDQFGDEVSLWQFHGNLVVINISPMWCAPCQELARGVEAMVQEYEGQPVVFVELVAETATGETPGAKHAAEWADRFGINSAPVLADTEGFYVNFAQGGAYPILVGISPQMKIFEGGFVAANGEEDVRTFIDANL